MIIRLKSTWQLYLFIGVIALILTTAISPLLPDWFNKYKAELIEDTRNIPNPNILYHDFDHDGFSEMAALKYQKDIDESALKIYAYNGGLINQWTLDEPWLQRSMIFGDYDHNGHDEVYVFTQANDSLFLYAIDYRNINHFLVYRAFIARAPTGTKHWDLRPIAGVFLDADGDGFDELVFNVMAGYAGFPRGLFSFSVHKKKVLYQSPVSGAFLALPTKVEIQSKSVILMSGSYALNNLEKDMPFSDHVAWLVVFDAQLNFLFPPVRFDYEKPEIKAIPFGPGNQFIAVLIKNHSKTHHLTYLELYDWKGKKLKQCKLTGLHWQLIQTKQNGSSEALLINNQQQIIFQLSPELELLNPRLVPNRIYELFNFYFDLDNDLKNEWLCRKENHLQIFDHDFEHVVSVHLPNFGWGTANFSLKLNGTHSPQLSLQSGGKKYLLTYQLNPYFFLKHLSKILLFGFIFFPLWLILFIYNKGSAYRATIQHIINNPDRGMMLLTHSGKITFMNHTIIDQFQLGLTDYKNQSVFSVFAPFPSFLEILQECLQQKQKMQQNISIAHQNVNLKAIVYANPITVFLGYTYGFYVEVNDYSKPLENDRLKVWSKTVQKMAHDIKTPLSSLLLNLKTLNLKLADHAPHTFKMIEPELNLMFQEINRVKDKTINFLKFTNLEPPRFGKVVVKELIQNTLELFKSYSKQSVTFHIEIAEDVEYLIGDAKQLQMALQAIIENAIDAIKGQGTIAITVSKVNPIHKQFAEFIEIDIADTGPGIPKDIIDKIYEPYFTTKKEGTGMGLAIAKKIIQEHNGEISIFSREGFSTVIKIMLPVGNTVPKSEYN